jgi:hypothetical protein
MNTLRQLLLAISDRLDGEGDVAYVKSAELGEVVGVGAKEVGARMAYIRESERVPVEVSKWSKTCAATTYRIQIPSWQSFETYLSSLLGEPEPTLTATV